MDFTHIYAGTSDSNIWFFDISAGYPVNCEIQGEDGELFGEIVGLDISPDNKKLAVASRRGEIHLYDTQDLHEPIARVKSNFLFSFFSNFKKILKKKKLIFF